jgi:hypothetical protein
LIIVLASFSLAHAEPPAYHAQIQEWATEKNWRLEDWRACKTTEETLEQALNSFCWAAKSRDMLKGARAGFYPRVMIEMAKFPDEDAAKRRMANFSVMPPSVKGVEAKLYVMRAGFRLGDLIFIVSTESAMFEKQMRDTAKDLTAKIAGTDYTCFGGCERKKLAPPNSKTLAAPPKGDPTQPDQQ